MNLRDQFDGPDERTWAWHGGIAVAETLVYLFVLTIISAKLRFALLPLPFIYGYWKREVAGWWYSSKKFRDWLGVGKVRRDHVMDVLTPTVMGLVLGWVLATRFGVSL